MSNFVPLTTFYLLKNVDIDVSYNNQYYFREWKVPADQYNFFYAKRFKQVNEGTYQRKNRGTISIPFQADEIRECKYIMWQNANYSDKWYYAFVTSIDYVNPNVSIINYQLDVFQTYYFEIKNSWKPSFIERMHTDRWNSDNTPVINTIPEGLEQGDVYRVLDRQNLYQIGDVSFIVIGMTKAMYGATDELISNVPSVLKYYIVPVSLNKTDYVFKYGIGSGAVALSTAQEVLDLLFHDDAYVNRVVSVYLLPYLPVLNTDLTYSIDYEDGGWTCRISHASLYTVTVSGITIIQLRNDFIPKPWHMVANKEKYDAFPVYEESKLLMHPFSFTEMSNDRGSAFVIKNEYVNGKRIEVGCFATITAMAKMSFLVRNYLNTGNINNAKIRLFPHSQSDFSVETYTRGYLYEQGINENSSGELPIIDDYTASYMQSHRNSINVSMNNAKLQYNQDLRNANTNYKISTTELRRDAIKGAIQTTGEAGSALAQLVDGRVLRGMSDFLSGASRSLATGSSTLVDMIAGKKVRDLNYDMANDVASTNYQKETASIMSAVQDAEQIPPSISTMGADYTFDVAYWRDGIYLYPKTLLPEYALKLTHYFRKYGYQVNENVNPEEITYSSGGQTYNHFDNRESWNYIKIREPILNANIPMDDLMAIKGIFMEGITLWHGDYVGDYDRSNNEVTGIYPHVGNNAILRYNVVPINNVSWYLRYSNGTRINSGDAVPLGTRVYIELGQSFSNVSGIIINGLAYPTDTTSFVINRNTLFELY